MLWLLHLHSAKTPTAHLTYLLKDCSVFCYLTAWRFFLPFMRSNVLFHNQNKVHTQCRNYYYTNGLNLFNERNSPPSLRKAGNFERSPRTRLQDNKKVFKFPKYFYFSPFLVTELFSAVSLWLTLFIIFQLRGYSELVWAVCGLYLIHGHVFYSILKTASAIAAVISSQLLGQMNSWWGQTISQQTVPVRLALLLQGLST